MQLNQTATFWKSLGRGGYGQLSYANPLLIVVRWENRQVLFKDNQGEDMLSNAVIYTKSEIKAEDYLFLGTSSSTTPKDLLGAFRVRMVYPMDTLNLKIRINKLWL